MKLSKAQREMLTEAVKRADFGGVILFDQYQERVAKNLHSKGLVTLPAGFGFVWGGRDGVRPTEAGRLALRKEAPDA